MYVWHFLVAIIHGAEETSALDAAGAATVCIYYLLKFVVDIVVKTIMNNYSLHKAREN